MFATIPAGLLFAQAAEPLPAASMPLGPLLGIIFGGTFLLLLLLGLKIPQIWILTSALSIGLGIGGFVYGLIVYNSPVEAPVNIRQVEHAALAIGCGAGGAVGGFILLIVGLLRLRMAAANTDAERRPLR